MISYTITVQNTGNATLTGVTVTDPYADAGSIVRGADVVGDNDALLEVGETWGYTAAHTVTQAEIDSNGGGDGLPREHGDGGQRRDRPGHRRCLGAGGAEPGTEHHQGRQRAAAARRMRRGELISYTITVANTGNATLTGVDGDRSVRGCGLDRARRRRGRRQRRPARGRRDLGLHGGAHRDPGRDRQQRRRRRLLENTATADSNETGPDTDDASVPVAQNPALNITKDASVPGGTADAAGRA